jgi:hypothetical protein
LFNLSILSDHNDIDLLVRDKRQVVEMLECRPRNSVQDCDSFTVQVNDSAVFFDIRYIGDGYYCSDWEEKMLSDRVFEDGFYKQSDMNYFFSLAYHAIIHKMCIVEDYYKKLELLFYKLNLDKSYNLQNYKNPFDLYFVILIEFIKKNEYMITKPKDPFVYFNLDFFRKIS